MTDRDHLDSLLTTAFALKSNPGAYALLLGAGVSAPSGIPTAWGVLTELVERLTLVDPVAPSVTGDAAHEWYRERFAREATYESVLEQIAPTPHERQRVLRDFFERSPEDIEARRKLPTLAHRSIARLARSGAVKVIMTLNFDRLIEQALRDEGIEPTIISSATDVAGMAPLHTLECCVIHLHGDYLNPTSMLNTADELHGYDPMVAALLRRVLEDYGLIIAGWSSTYDPALRHAIAEHYPSRYTLTWIEPGSISERATDLRVLKRGSLIPMDADTSFGQLADAMDALAAREARHPLTVTVAVETAKRELAGRSVAISVHDVLRVSLADLDARPELHLEDWHDASRFNELLGRVEEASRLPAALIATLSYWGDPDTDRWWRSELDRFATPAARAGVLKLLKLRTIPGSILFYAAGVAAVAAQRFDLLNELFTSRPFNALRGEYGLLAYALDPAETYDDVAKRERRHFLLLAPILAESLLLGEAAVEDAWQLFEVLRLAVLTSKNPRVASERESFQQLSDELKATKASGGGDIMVWDRRQRVLGDVARYVPVNAPHVRVTDFRGTEGYQSPTARHLLDTLASDSNHPLVSSGLISSIEEFAYALHVTSTALGMVASQWRRASSGRTNVGVLTHLWCDTGESAAR